MQPFKGGDLVEIDSSVLTASPEPTGVWVGGVVLWVSNGRPFVRPDTGNQGLYTDANRVRKLGSHKN